MKRKHVVITGRTGSMRRVSVESRALPVRQATKFITQSTSVLDGTMKSLIRSECGDSDWKPGQPVPMKLFGPLDRVLSSCHSHKLNELTGGLVLLEVPESTLRLRLGPTDILHWESGQLIAWSSGVSFDVTRSLCRSVLKSIRGPGTIWICRSSLPGRFMFFCEGFTEGCQLSCSRKRACEHLNEFIKIFRGLLLRQIKAACHVLLGVLCDPPNLLIDQSHCRIGLLIDLRLRSM